MAKAVLISIRPEWVNLPHTCGDEPGHAVSVALLYTAPSGGSGADDLFLQRRKNRQRAELIQNHPIPSDFIHLSHQSSFGEL